MVASQTGRDSYQALDDNQAGRTSPGRMVGTSLIGLLALVTAFAAGRSSASQVHRVGSATAAAAFEEAPIKPVELWEPQLSPAFHEEPIAKNTVRRFDAYLMQMAAFADPQTKLANVEQWLAPDFEYETVGFPTSRTPAGWCVSGEEQEFRTTFNMSVFSQMLFFGSDDMATTTSYGNVFWKEPLFGVPAPKEWVYFRVTDFYSARKTSPTRGQLYYNFMMIDFADLLRRVGHPVLPKATLPEGLVLTSEANDGVPAPLSVVAREQDCTAARKLSLAALQEDWAGSGPAETKAWASDMIFYGPGGIGTARGTEQYHKHVLEPFRAAFADRQVETKIFGCEGNYCGAFGELRGRHVGTWLGLKASGKPVAIRFAFHWHVTDGSVKEGWAIFDVPGLFKQVGLDFFAMAAETPLQI